MMNMKLFPVIILLLSMSLNIWADNSNLTADAILTGLKERQEEDLTKFITFLDYDCNKSLLTDREINVIVKQLKIIQDTDPYQKMIDTKGGKTNLFPNRHVSRQCMFKFQFQTISNSLRKLPVEQRVSKIMDGIIHPQDIYGYSTYGNYASELGKCGKEAVPFIIQYKPKESYYCRAIVGALAGIVDVRGLDYVIEVLNNKEDSFSLERPICASALKSFYGIDSETDKRIIRILAEALKDETYENIDRHMPQQYYQGHKPYIGRYYTVKEEASKSLSAITGKNWGLLFNDDYAAWSAWFASEDQDTFSPATLKRSDKDIAKLIEYMFHRYMSARPNPWQPQNILEEKEGIAGLSRDLKALGEKVVPLIIKEYQARITETPLWRKELMQWTKQLLISLDWKDSKKLAEKLDS